jgi:hypothetical protein
VHLRNVLDKSKRSPLSLSIYQPATIHKHVKVLGKLREGRLSPSGSRSDAERCRSRFGVALACRGCDSRRGSFSFQVADVEDTVPKSVCNQVGGTTPATLKRSEALDLRYVRDRTYMRHILRVGHICRGFACTIPLYQYSRSVPGNVCVYF